MKKHFKRLVSFLMVFVLCFSLAPSALAAEDDLSKRIPDESKQYYVDVIDENGNAITLLVEENTYYPETTATRSTPGEDSGRVEGTIKTVTTKISNASLGYTGAAGQLVGTAIKSGIAKMAVNASVVAIGSTIGSGISVAAAVTAAIMAKNVYSGKNGFVVTSKYKWTHFQSTIQGYDYYDWSYMGSTVGTY